MKTELAAADEAGKAISFLTYADTGQGAFLKPCLLSTGNNLHGYFSDCGSFSSVHERLADRDEMEGEEKDKVKEMRWRVRRRTR